MNTEGHPGRINGLRIFLAGLIPVIVYLGLSQETVSSFAAVTCEIRPGPPSPEPFISRAMISNIFGYCAPVWAALLLASPRKFPRACYWLIAFAGLYCLMFLIFTYAGSNLETGWSDDCRTDYERQQPSMFEWVAGIVILTPITVALIGVIAGLRAVARKRVSGKSPHWLSFQSVATALIIMGVVGSLLSLHFKNKKNQDRIQTVADTIVLSVAIDHKKDIEFDIGALRTDAQILLEQQNSHTKVSDTLQDFQLDEDLMLRARLSGKRALLPFWKRSYEAETAVQLEAYSGCEMVIYERSGTTKCMPEDKCKLTEEMGGRPICQKKEP